MITIRFPNITEPTAEGQIAQLKSYLYQLVQQLNWALSTLESGNGQASSAETPAYGDISAETFYELKSLLVKSSDTLNSFYEKINTKLEGQYVKQTEFNEHKQSEDGKYIAKADFDAYKQSVTESFDDLGNQYVSQEIFEEHEQQNAETFVLATDFDAYKQEMSAKFSEIEGVIAEIQQTIQSMQETGGEEHG
jgi:hypothetical protein